MNLNFYLLGFQDPATPIMEGIIDLHNYIFFYLVLVLFFVISIISNILYYFYYLLNVDNKDVLAHRYLLLAGNKVTHGTIIEIVWTIIPSVILMLIAVPSFALLYSMDEIIAPGLIVRAIGHQWYWSYEYSDYINYKYHLVGAPLKVWPKFDSYMINESELVPGQLRLLEVDYQVLIPVKKHIRMLITSVDVLHSWAVPSLGIKTDAVPGRLSQASLYAKREGSFFGQCSEICGVNHGFMPIVVKAIDDEQFIWWYWSFNDPKFNIYRFNQWVKPDQYTTKGLSS